MNLDKPLEELIADKRTPAARPSGGATRGRVSRDRASAVPYARPAPRSTGDTWVHDAYTGPAGGRRGGGAGFAGAPRFNGPPGLRGNVGFTGVSPRIEVVGLHYEVTTADLKNIFSQAGTLVQGPTIRNAYYSSFFHHPSYIDTTLLSHKQYDRSGRSLGEAEMEYASVQQAKSAINKFDGAMTKGQTITIKYLPPILVRATSATSFGPGPALNGGRPQVQTGAALLARIQGAAPAVPRGGGVVRGGGGVARGRGGPVRGRGGAGRGGASARPGPPNAGNLDDELDAFMKTDASGDVQMA